MKALTLKHPWPWAICRLGKDIENRVWKPPEWLIGEDFAIHGGAVPRITIANDVRVLARELWREHKGEVLPLHRFDDAIMPGIVAVVRLACVVTSSESPWFEGPYGWRIDNLFILPRPIACKGAQGLWDAPEEYVAEIGRQWRARETVEPLATGAADG